MWGQAFDGALKTHLRTHPSLSEYLAPVLAKPLPIQLPANTHHRRKRAMSVLGSLPPAWSNSDGDQGSWLQLGPVLPGGPTSRQMPQYLAGSWK